jgi:hypothetical protein
VLAHGEARPVPGGWVLADLPGVRLVASGDRKRSPAAEPPAAPSGTIVALDVLGPEALAPED